MKGQLAPVDIVKKNGDVIVAKSRRISKRHIKLMQESDVSHDVD